MVRWSFVLCLKTLLLSFKHVRSNVLIQCIIWTFLTLASTASCCILSTPWQGKHITHIAPLAYNPYRLPLRLIHYFTWWPAVPPICQCRYAAEVHMALSREIGFQLNVSAPYSSIVFSMDSRPLDFNPWTPENFWCNILQETLYG